MALHDGIEVNCPGCGNPVTWSEKSPWRPFCGKRCQLCDLNDWVDEKKRIPGDGGHSDSVSWDHDPD